MLTILADGIVSSTQKNLNNQKNVGYYPTFFCATGGGALWHSCGGDRLCHIWQNGEINKNDVSGFAYVVCRFEIIPQR